MAFPLSVKGSQSQLHPQVGTLLLTFQHRLNDVRVEIEDVNSPT